MYEVSSVTSCVSSSKHVTLLVYFHNNDLNVDMLINIRTTFFTGILLPMDGTAVDWPMTSGFSNRLHVLDSISARTIGSQCYLVLPSKHSH